VIQLPANVPPPLQYTIPTICLHRAHTTCTPLPFHPVAGDTHPHTPLHSFPTHAHHLSNTCHCAWSHPHLPTQGGHLLFLPTTCFVLGGPCLLPLPTVSSLPCHKTGAAHHCATPWVMPPYLPLTVPTLLPARLPHTTLPYLYPAHFTLPLPCRKPCAFHIALTFLERHSLVPFPLPLHMPPPFHHTRLPHIPITQHCGWTDSVPCSSLLATRVPAALPFLWHFVRLHILYAPILMPIHLNGRAFWLDTY